MSFKQLNPGLMTSTRGCELIAFSFRVNGSSDPNGLVQGMGNAVASVSRDSAGTFEVQFNKNYPRQIVAFRVDIAQATATSTIEDARYVLDSYDASAGTLTIETITDDGDGTLTVEDITDNTVVSAWFLVQNLDGLVEDAAS